MRFYKNQLPSFIFCGLHTKQHGVRGLSKNYHMLFDPKIGGVTCEIRQIQFVCAEFTHMLDKPQIPGLIPKEQPRYLHVADCSYWKVLGSFNSWNIITLSHKETQSEAFEDINQVVLDGISDNMALLVQSCKYGAMKTAY